MKCKDIGAFLYFFVEYLGGSLWHRIVGKCGNMWGLGWGGAPKYTVSAILLSRLRKAIILENISAREFRYFRQVACREFNLV